MNEWILCKWTQWDARKSQQLFWVEASNITLYQMKISRHKCCKITATTIFALICGSYTYLFSPDKGSPVTFFQPKIIVSFLHLKVLICKVFMIHFSKHQFVLHLVICIINESFYYLNSKTKRKTSILMIKLGMLYHFGNITVLRVSWVMGLNKSLSKNMRFLLFW